MPEFNTTEYVTRLGRSLIKEFEEARQATTPQLIGESIETPVRRRLEQVLPRGIAVGSGCIIDSYGSCSRQQDVVLYERDICPVFSINDTPQSTYYPCEGVMAVIEVKSSVASTELQDSFEKIASVKRLRRYDVYSPGSGQPSLQHRRYEGTQMANMVQFSDAKEMERRGLNQIFGAILTERLRMKPNTFHTKFVEFVRLFGDEYSPNMVEILDGGTLIPCVVEDGEARAAFSAKTATHFQHSESDPMQNLIHSLYLTYRHGVTSPTAAFDRYIVGIKNESPYFGPVIRKLD